MFKIKRRMFKMLMPGVVILISLARHLVMGSLQLSCPNKVILRNGTNGEVKCNISYSENNRTFRKNSTYSWSVDKLPNAIAPNCHRTVSNSSLDHPLLKYNKTAVRLIFHTIQWSDNGTYKLTHFSANGFTTKVQIDVMVSDLPRQPKEIKPTTDLQLDLRRYGLRLEADLPPRLNDCGASLQETFVLNYSLNCVGHLRKGCTGSVICKQFQQDVVSCDILHVNVCDKDFNSSNINVTLQGQNDLGYGKPKRYVSGKLYLYVPLYHVNDVQVNATQSKELDIYWRRPDCLSIVYEYNIIIYKSTNNANGSKWQASSQITPPDCYKMHCNYPAKSLNSFTKYKICLIARDKRRPGNWSKQSCHENSTIEDVPASPPVITNILSETTPDGNRKVTLKWKPPKKSDLNGVLRTFAISYVEDKRMNDPVIKNVNAHTYEYVIDHLDRHRGYNVRVAACNSRKCKESTWTHVAMMTVEGNRPTTMKLGTVIILTTTVVAVFFFGILFIVVYFYKSFYRSQRYDAMKNDVDEVHPRERGIGEYEDPPDNFVEQGQAYDEVHHYIDANQVQLDQERIGNSVPDPYQIESSLDNGILRFQTDDEGLVELLPVNT